MRRPKIFLDFFCEIHDILRPYADGDFWKLDEIDIEPGCVYVVGRLEMARCWQLIRQIVDENLARIIFSNPAEGSETMLGQFQRLTIYDLAHQGTIPVISGGAVAENIRCLWYEHFLHRMVNFEENLQAMTSVDSIYQHKKKPYKFLFLNGRMRAHRKYLISNLKIKGLLDNCLWTNLHHNSAYTRRIYLWHQGKNLMTEPEAIHYLPAEYEVDMYSPYINKDCTDANVKFSLFNNEWGEAYIKPAPYIDSFFSLVTETVFDHPYSFRTEKIWKPLMIGHPWICASNAGFYKDIRNLGFKTYQGIIDESFDSIDDPQIRLERISHVVEDLCNSDLSSFLSACESISRFNQQHLLEFHQQHMKDFPTRFLKFVEDIIHA